MSLFADVDRHGSYQALLSTTVKSSGLRCRPSTRKGYVLDPVGLLLETNHCCRCATNTNYDSDAFIPATMVLSQTVKATTNQF
jgi:hypothetical protein